MENLVPRTSRTQSLRNFGSLRGTKKEIQILLSEYTPDKTSELGLATKIKHKIRLRDVNPIQQKMRPHSSKVLEAIHAEILDMLKKDVISNTILDILGSAHYLSLINLYKVYFQVPLEKQNGVIPIQENAIWTANFVSHR